MSRSKSHSQKLWTHRTEAAAQALQEIQAAAVKLTDTPCSTQGKLWGAIEKAHRTAPNPEAAANIAAQALTMCPRCPKLPQCHTWASLDHYTGLAAGRAWINGTPQDAPNSQPPKKIA